jgi:hypothetical protein
VPYKLTVNKFGVRSLVNRAADHRVRLISRDDNEKTERTQKAAFQKAALDAAREIGAAAQPGPYPEIKVGDWNICVSQRDSLVHLSINGANQQEVAPADLPQFVRAIATALAMVRWPIPD